MSAPRPATIGALRNSAAHQHLAFRSVKDEMRANVITRLDKGEPIFPGIAGYEDTVVPSIVNAILARHNLILLGLRGQAKSRIIRQLVSFLDEEMPSIEGCEINDNPFRPICRWCKLRIAEMGEETPVSWIPRDQRFVEKLATPDVTIADLLGDIDPIKAARGGRLLSDELTIHYGLLPRANRGIFAINELPDLAGKVQVGLFNIMQEGDVQIKGYPIRLPLDVALVFSANPEDYTARGKIITPLKDRIGSEINTHYPAELSEAVAITQQEAWTGRDGGRSVLVPEIIREVVERIAFVARADKRVDKRSGVSQRLPISVLETAVSNAERRAIVTGSAAVVPRPSDIYAALPAITGKLELEYEGEQQGVAKVARDIVVRAIGDIFRSSFDIESFEGVIKWFEGDAAIKLADMASDLQLLKQLSMVSGLSTAARRFVAHHDLPDQALTSVCELILEGLVAERKLSRSEERGYARVPREKASRAAESGGPRRVN